MIIKAINIYTSTGEVVNIPYENFMRNPSCHVNKRKRGSFDTVSLDFKVDSNLKVLGRKGSVHNNLVDVLSNSDITGIEIETKSARLFGQVDSAENKKFEYLKPLGDNAYRLRVVS